MGGGLGAEDGGDVGGEFSGASVSGQRREVGECLCPAPRTGERGNYTHLFHQAAHADNIRQQMAASPFANLLGTTEERPAAAKH